jgi:hypothetical protein
MKQRADEVTRILDRVAADVYTHADVERLRQLTVTGDHHVVQVGRHNINIGQGRDIHIGDRIYRGAEAAVVREVLYEALADGSSGHSIARGSLRSISGVVFTLGTLIALLGMALFAYGLISWMIEAVNDPTAGFGGPDPITFVGFGIGFVGGLVSGFAQLLRGWERPRGR